MLDSRRWRTALLVVVLAAATVVVPSAGATARPPVGVRVQRLTMAVRGTVERTLPFAATNVALYWVGHPDAKVRVAFSRDGKTFGRAIDAGRDELGAARANGVTYGAMLPGRGAKAMRVTSDQPLQKLTTLALLDQVGALVGSLLGREPPPVGGATPPPIISRSGWAADESLRASNGKETWPPAFAPVQKLIVHHTATTNADPNPAATVRAIYQYHAVTQGWGDIGYNFLIDEAGRVYKGRNSHLPGNSTDSLSGEDGKGNGVIGAHAQHFNAGSVGVALLGTLTTTDATPAAKHALAQLLAWKADAHRIDPHGASVFTNPSTGHQSVFANIGGHRDVNAATECPGDLFYDSLPALRAEVAARTQRA